MTLKLIFQLKFESYFVNMFRLFVVALALSACLAEEEPQASAASNPDYHRLKEHLLKEGIARVRSDIHRVLTERKRDHRHRDRGHHDHHRDHRHRDHQDDKRWFEHNVYHEHDEPEGPVILRSIKHDEGHKPDIAAQNKIIADVYSPDYAEPTWVLDYRYLKSGGRDYTRGPGGQIIILPKGIHTNEHKEYQNYDEMIEALRLKNLAARKTPDYFMPLGEGEKHEQKNEHRDDDDDLWKHLHSE